MANRRFTTQFLRQFEVNPVLLSCNFIVDSTNGNGFGVRSLKGEGIAKVYMNTSATPVAGNPNPAAGIILVQFTDTYARYLSGFSGFVSQVGTSVTATTIHTIATITSLGTATLAQWTAVGLPKGAVPQVGLSFIATASATIGGSATVAPPATAGSGITSIEAVGDPSTTISAPTALQSNDVQPIGQVAGGYLILRCMASGTQTAPANNSVCGLSFYLSNSSNTVKSQ
jgi:hypothetical protein